MCQHLRKILKDSNEPEVGPGGTHAGARRRARRAPGTVRGRSPITERESWTRIWTVLWP